MQITGDVGVAIGGDVSHVATANDTDYDATDMMLLIATWGHVAS